MNFMNTIIYYNKFLKTQWKECVLCINLYLLCTTKCS